MLSIGRLAGARWAGEYYLARQAGCPADYYLGAGERAGRWLGGGSAALGLTGRVDPAALRALLAGRSPDGGCRLVPPVWRADPRCRLPAGPLATALADLARARGRPPAALFGDERLAEAYRRAARPGALIGADLAAALARAAGLDPQAVYGAALPAALAHAGERVDTRLAGLDLTFSAPKSVSVLYGLGEPGVAGQVRAAHETAVAAAVDYLQRVAGHGLRGHQGDRRRARRIPTTGFVAAAFEHRVNRCGDPQLHTHVVLANLLFGADGRTSAVDSRECYAQARTAGFLYQAGLRYELTVRLGVDWTAVVNGHAEIAGIPDGLRALFAKRRAQIEADLAIRGRADPAAAQQATLATRPAKPVLPAVGLRERWAAEARAAGYDPARLAGVCGRTAPAPLPAGTLARLVSPSGLTERASAFDRRDVLRALAEAAPHGAPVERIEGWAQHVLAGSDVVPLLGAADRRRYATAELLAVEAAALAAADRLAGQPGIPAGQPGIPAGQPASAAAVRDGRPLTATQDRLARRLLAGGSRLQLIIGPAGSGKTSLLRAAHAGWAAAGLPVLGTAVAAIAAAGLQADTTICSASLSRLLADADRPDPATGAPAGLPRHAVIVLDEAGQVGTRQFAALLGHVETAQASLVCVGDPYQLPAVAAGGLFTALTARHRPGRLADNLRQQQPWEATALAQLRAGDITAGLAAYQQHGRIHTATGRTDLLARLLDDWQAARETVGDPAGVLILTARRADVALLNTAARARLAAAGALTGPTLTVRGAGLGVRTFAAGDQVIVTANHYRAGLLNGTRGQLTAVDPTAGTACLRDLTGRDHLLDAASVADRLEHGYALTCHKAQGQTVEVALLYGTAALTRQAGYVGLSRGRTANHLYAITDDLDRATAAGDPVTAETDDHPHQRTDTPPAPPAVEQALVDLAARLRTSVADRLATDQLPPDAFTARVAALRDRQHRPRPERPERWPAPAEPVDRADPYPYALDL